MYTTRVQMHIRARIHEHIHNSSFIVGYCNMCFTCCYYYYYWALFPYLPTIQSHVRKCRYVLHYVSARVPAAVNLQYKSVRDSATEFLISLVAALRPSCCVFAAGR